MSSTSSGPTYPPRVLVIGADGVRRWTYGSCQSESPARLELEMIRRTALGLAPVGGLSLAEHVHRFIELAWPHTWEHRWTKLIRDEVCRASRSTTTIWGPASSGKTATTAMLALTLYWALPDQTTVICSTTTLDMLDYRVWGEIKMRFKEARERFPWLAGNLIDSRRRLCTDDKNELDGRDFRNGIVGVACKKASGEWQGLASFSGVKNKFLVLVADELHVMEANFLQGLGNLKSNPNFIGIFLGNLVDLETPLGEAAEPDCGWDAFPDSDKTRAYNLKMFEGRGIQLVGLDSPNYDYPEGAEPFTGLIGRRFVAELKHNYGEGTPMFIAQAGGTIPRSSMANRVITKEVCRKFHAFEPVVWGAGKLTRLYAMDVSYTVSHGDRTVGAPLVFGQDVEARWRLAYEERPKIFSVPRLGLGETVEDSLAMQAKVEMDRLGIPYGHLFYDGTGRSSFTASAMRVIGTMVQPVEFGGRASARPNFVGKRVMEGPDKGMLLPCDMVFLKFVSELWFAWRYLVEADQLRGLPEDTAKEGYMRLWHLAAGNKLEVEPKEEMKLRLGRSPDLADCLVVGIEGARRLGFVIGGEQKRNSRGGAWLQGIRRDYEARVREQELSYE